MTSKISYSKFIEFDIRRRGWLIALNSVALFLLMPVYTLFFLKNEPASYFYIGDPDWLILNIPGLFNGSTNIFLFACLLAAALLCAFTGFAWLHAREQLDFYHGLPLTRNQWFFVSYVSGLLLFLIPYLVCGFLTLFSVYAAGYMSQTILKLCFSALLGGVLGFLLIYHIGILGMFLSGQNVTGVLSALILLVYGAIPMTLYDSLADTFWDTWVESTAPDGAALRIYLSPLFLFRTVLWKTASKQTDWQLLYAVVLTAALLALILFLYRRYAAETAGNALSFPKTAPVVKVLIAVPTSLFIGLFIHSYRADSSRLWIFFFSIFFALLLCMMTEFIYHHDLRQLFKGPLSTGISVAAVVLLLCAMQFDVFGYDTYLPKKEKLNSISMESYDLSFYLTFPESWGDFSYDPVSDIPASDYGSLYELARNGVEKQREGITVNSLDAWDDEQTAVTFYYQMENGRKVARAYAIERMDLLYALEELCENKDFRRELFPIFHLNREDIVSISLSDLYYRPEPLYLTEEQKNALLDAYEQDILSADISSLQTESPIGSFTITLPDRTLIEAGQNLMDNVLTIDRFYLYRFYTNTLNLLEEYGYTIHTTIQTEDILSMYYSPNIDSDKEPSALGILTSESSADFSSGDGIPVTDEAAMRRILDRISFDDCQGIVGDSLDFIGSVEITLTGSTYPNTYLIYE